MHVSRRRSGRTLLLALVSALVLALAGGIGASAAPSGAGKAVALEVVSLADPVTGLSSAVAGRPFSVVVRSVDESGLEAPLVKATTLRLTRVGTGQLLGSATIAKNASRATISATLSTVENDVLLAVSVVPGGQDLAPPPPFEVDVLTYAAKANARPREALQLSDPSCVAPTQSVPTCVTLVLPNGASGPVTVSGGDCEGVVACRVEGTVEGLVVTGLANLKDEAGNPLYDEQHPATLIVSCDKTLCANGGAGSFPLLVDIDNDDTTPFVQAPECPAKGTIAPGDDFCLDTVQTKRDGAGDTYSVLLFDYDVRASHP